MKKLVIVAILVLSLASQLIAEPATFVDNNAALRYLMALGFMPKLKSDDCYELSGINSLETLKALDSKSRKELESPSASSHLSTMFRLLDLAAECTESTFIVDQDCDYESMIPPYRSLRQFARFVNAHAWIDAEKGDYAAAARKFIHIFRLGKNLGGDGIAISCMVGIGIQRIAVESINNLLEICKDSDTKKVLHDYFSLLPKPMIDGSFHINKEKLYIYNTLNKAEKQPKKFAEFEIFKDETEKTVKAAAVVSACRANQRVLLGALEMYMMDNTEAPSDLDSAAIINKLVEEKYLKLAPACENKGKYAIKFETDGDFSVSCSCGVSLDETVVEEKGKEISPAVMEKINAYIKSGAFVSDKKEVEAIFAEIVDIDPYAATSDEKAGKVAERIENSKNPLINTLVINPQSFYKALRENQQRIDDLVKRLAQ